jgi:hypothetical protein
MTSEPRQSLRLPRRRWLLIAGLAALGLVALVQSNRTALVGGDYPTVESYRLAGDRIVVLTVVVAPRSWTRVTNLVETPTEVRVTVESLDWPIPLPGTGELNLEPVTVALRDALGSRAVLDPAGQAIPVR